MKLLYSMIIKAVIFISMDRVSLNIAPLPPPIGQSPNPPLGDAKQQTANPRSMDEHSTTQSPSPRVQGDRVEGNFSADADRDDAIGNFSIIMYVL